MMYFEDFSSEIILCIWEQLSSADVIYSFSNLNCRIHSLLVKYHGLYKQIELAYCSLSACRFLCQQVPSIIEWRLGLTVLKLGSVHRCSQIQMFVDEVSKLILSNHFARHEKTSVDCSKDSFHLLLTYNHDMRQTIFPQLTSLFICQCPTMDENCRDTLLFPVADGSSMRTFSWNAHPNQAHHAKAFFDWLFRWSSHLEKFVLETSDHYHGFDLPYEHTLLNKYEPHCSLVHLNIKISDLNTLYVLLHYLPELVHLAVYITATFLSSNTMGKSRIKNLNYSKKLRIFNLRHMEISGLDCSCIERLLDTFRHTLEEFALFLTQNCDGVVDKCFDGHCLAKLCQNLSRLHSLHFAIRLQFLERPSDQTLNDFIEALRQSYWIDGPLGRIRVCVNYHQVSQRIQIYSLPYRFPENIIDCTIDIIDTKFNIDENENTTTRKNLPMTLELLWCGMRWLCLSFVEQQKVPLAFFHAIKYLHGRNKILVLLNERGILPDNIENHLQLTQFSTLRLESSIDTNSTYDFQESMRWLRLLPGIKCFCIKSTELKYWLTEGFHCQYVHTFLEGLDRLYIDCSDISNLILNEGMMRPLVSSVINRCHFPRLKSLCFIMCKHISSAWLNIHTWINLILTHSHQHQLQYIRFSFIEKEKEIINMKTDDEIMTNTESTCTIDIHRFVSENRISFWIERK